MPCRYAVSYPHPNLICDREPDFHPSPPAPNRCGVHHRSASALQSEHECCTCLNYMACHDRSDRECQMCEHYMPTVLAFMGVGEETTCNGHGIVNVNWRQVRPKQ